MHSRRQLYCVTLCLIITHIPSNCQSAIDFITTQLNVQCSVIVITEHCTFTPKHELCNVKYVFSRPDVRAEPKPTWTVNDYKFDDYVTTVARPISDSL